MNAKQLAKKLEHQRRKVLIYETEWPEKMGKKAMAFVMNNFESESYHDQVKIPWKKLKKPRNGKKLQSQRLALKDSVKVQYLNKAFRLYSRLAYAGVHNSGYKGTQQVRAHQRRKKLSGSISGADGKQYAFGANMSLRTRRPLKNKPVYNVTNVSAFTRKMNIPRRQFMPDAKRGSHYLLKELKEQTQKDIRKILSSIR